MAAHLRDLLGISIHAPYAGRDVLLQRGDKLHGISIHAPRAGRDDTGGRYTVIVDLFQSTRPVRGATDVFTVPPGLFPQFQSTRPVRGATMDRVLAEIISGFQSTRPMRGATNKSWKLSVICCISIHAPHAGRD